MGRERGREDEENAEQMLTMKVEVGRRGRGGDAFVLVAFGRDLAVVTSAIAALVSTFTSLGTDRGTRPVPLD